MTHISTQVSTQVSISTFEPQIVSFNVMAHGQLLRVQVESHLLKNALRLNESTVDLNTAVQQHIEPIRDIAWAQHEKTHAQNIVLSQEDLQPLSVWAARTGPPVVEQVPERGPAL
jgi:hypothetical protein